MGGGTLVLGFAACGGDDAVFTETPVTVGTGGSGGTGGGAGGEELRCVLDGNRTDTEECDDGNSIPGDGCEADCSFTCSEGALGDERCDDGDPCNGAETCTAEHTCASGAAEADGTSCGAGKVCKGGVCGDDVCGDLFVSAGEECDDGNLVAGDGCDDCSFSCTSTEPAACAPSDPCAGQGSCDDVTHTCTPGTPLADGTACGMGSFCAAGTCTPAVCPNGVVDPGEACDDNNTTDGDGCDADCTLSCADPAMDCPVASACNQAQCSMANVCEEVADATQNGDVCGSNLVCNNGACIAPNAQCGNGMVEMGEACDFGTGNGPNTGCTTACQFSCSKAPDSCPDANACNGVETCVDVTVAGQTGQACVPGTNLADCSACTGGLCQSGACQPATCGDGCVSGNEQCEPPNTMTCSASCTTTVCGNGVRESGEQCDDGNTANNDGCDASCAFEQVERIHWLEMQFATDAFCTANRLGGAIVGGTAQSQLQGSLDAGVADGTINVIQKALGLDDLTGTSDPAVSLGIVGGSPVAGAAYDGTNDLDWWYTLDPLTVDANGVPTGQLAGSIAAKQLDAGPGAINLAINLGGSPATLNMSNVTLRVAIGATSAPLTSAGAPPGHLASENLDPGLVSYASAGQPTANGAGKLCGRVSAASLAQVPIPAALAGTGLLNCSKGYSTSNSMLDVIVGGCTILFIQQIAPTQPDSEDPTKPAAGSGPIYNLTTNPTTHAVNGCRDGNGQTVNLAACLEDATYTSYFKYTTGRVILR